MKKLFVFIVILHCYITSAQRNTYEYSLENSESLLRFLDKNKVQYDVNDLAVLNQLAVWVEYHNLKKLIVPSVYLFDGEGNRIIEDLDIESCGQVLKGLDSTEKIKTYKKDPADNLGKWLSEFEFYAVNDNPFIQPYDLYVIIMCGSMVKIKSSNETAFNWYNSIKNQSDLNIKIKPILLNIDLMDSWDIPEEVKKQIGLK